MCRGVSVGRHARDSHCRAPGTQHLLFASFMSGAIVCHHTLSLTPHNPHQHPHAAAATIDVTAPSGEVAIVDARSGSTLVKLKQARHCVCLLQMSPSPPARTDDCVDDAFVDFRGVVLLLMCLRACDGRVVGWLVGGQFLCVSVCLDCNASCSFFPQHTKYATRCQWNSSSTLAASTSQVIAPSPPTSCVTLGLWPFRVLCLTCPASPDMI